VAALLLFVGHQALRTARENAVHRPAPIVPSPADTTPPTASAAESLKTDSLSLQRGAKISPAELRRRIEVAAAGTYISDMLADRDSVLTRWPERIQEPIRVWVQRTSTVPDWNPDFANVARTAFDEWGAASPPLRFMFIVDSTRADVRVSFADRMADGNRLGMTTHTHDQDGWIVGAEILVAVHDRHGAPAPGNCCHRAPRSRPRPRPRPLARPRDDHVPGVGNVDDHGSGSGDAEVALYVAAGVCKVRGSP
jgi:hypothetical protein